MSSKRIFRKPASWGLRGTHPYLVGANHRAGELLILLGHLFGKSTSEKRGASVHNHLEIREFPVFPKKTPGHDLDPRTHALRVALLLGITEMTPLSMTPGNLPENAHKHEATISGVFRGMASLRATWDIGTIRSTMRH